MLLLTACVDVLSGGVTVFDGSQKKGTGDCFIFVCFCVGDVRRWPPSWKAQPKKEVFINVTCVYRMTGKAQVSVSAKTV